MDPIGNPEENSHGEQKLPEEKKSSPLKQIRTFQGDVAEALHHQNESLVSIQRQERHIEDTPRVIAEPSTQKEGFVPPVISAPPKPLVERNIDESGSSESVKRIILLMIGTLVLLSLGGLIGFYAYKTYKEKTALPPIETMPNRFVTVQSAVNIQAGTISREAFIASIAAERQREPADGKIVQIDLLKGSGTTTTYIITKDLLNILGSKAPANLVRAFNPLFMMGILGGKATSASSSPVHTFILIKLDSFENAYGGMLSWEQNLADDLLPLFADEAIVATMPSDTRFTDVTIQNKDARVLKDPSGQSVLLYAFFDNSMLVITDTEQSLRTLINQLNTQKLSR